MTTNFVIYSDLSRDLNLWNAWQRHTEFSKSNLDQLDGKIRVEIKEFKAERVGESDILWQSALSECLLQINSFECAVMVCIEHSAMARNKLRSFKGLLFDYKKHQRLSYLEKEYNFGDKTTIIGGLVDCKSLRSEEVKNIFFGNYLSFFLCSDEDDLFNENFYKIVFNESVNTERGDVYINYGNLLLQLLGGDVQLLKFGGDGGDQEVTLQKFTDQSSQHL